MYAYVHRIIFRVLHTFVLVMFCFLLYFELLSVTAKWLLIYFHSFRMIDVRVLRPQSYGTAPADLDVWPKIFTVLFTFLLSYNKVNDTRVSTSAQQ